MIRELLDSFSPFPTPANPDQWSAHCSKAELDEARAELERGTGRPSCDLRLLTRRLGTAPARRLETPAGDDVDEVIPLAAVERKYILQVLDRFDGNRTHAARALGIGAQTLWRKLKSWGVAPPGRGRRARTVPCR